MQNNNPSFLASCKSITKEWFLSSTAHAVPNIFRTKNTVLKIVWLSCLLASGIYCMISMAKCLHTYLQYPTYITTSIVQEIPMTFPAVTICNLKNLNKTKLKSYLTPQEFDALFFDPKMFNSPVEYIYVQQYMVGTILTVQYNQSVKQNSGFKLEDMLISCLFNYKFCTVDEFTYFYSANYGSCYTFNKGVNKNGEAVSIRSVLLSGEWYGFVLELFLGHPETESIFDFRDGLVISIHNQSSIPFTEGVIKVAAGSESDVIIDRVFYTRLGHHYGGCLKDTSKNSSFSSTSFDRIVRTLGMTYSQKYCFEICIQKWNNIKCNCSNSFLALLNEKYGYCTFLDRDCVVDVITNFGNSVANAECERECPFECDSIEYQTTTLNSLYPTEFYKSYVLSNHSLIKDNNISYKDINKSVVKVNIYYKNMLYMLVEEKPQMTTENFFSNIGGTMGLYLGISLLSVVELFELGFNLISAYFNSKQKRKIEESSSKGNLKGSYSTTSTMSIKRNNFF